MRSGEGPAIIEAEVYRYFHQNGPYPGSAFGYRTKDEEAQWRERDALYLPRFPDDKISELRGTLQYPPSGSATGRNGGHQ